MHPAELLVELARPAAYPHPVDQVVIFQTHISMVFLAGPYAYKVKKPVQLGFLDFSPLERRHYYCEQEVSLNRRLAPDVYLGVVPIVRTAAGVRIDQEGEVIDWAVKMRRLPESATLQAHLERDDLEPRVLPALAQRLAEFHATAARGPEISAFGRLEVVAGNVRENFQQSQAQAGTVMARRVWERVRQLSEEQLSRLGPLIEERAGRGIPCDTHGDLRLDHVYLLPDAEPPGDLVVLDCIEFNERFRHADPIADVAFLIMDLKYQGYRLLARSFGSAYLEAAGDKEGAALVPFYTAYRAVVRAKVEGMKASESEVPEAERQRARFQARAHWLLALAELEEPIRRPCLVLLSGPPGSGKSTLAAGLADQADFTVIRSDVVRKELANGRNSGLYSPEMTERTYNECLRRLEALLSEGERVLIDANCRREQQRQLFLRAAVQLGVPAVLLECRASSSTVRQRLASRQGDVSDADWHIYEQVVSTWEPPTRFTLRFRQLLETDGPREQVLESALAVLREHGLV